MLLSRSNVLDELESLEELESDSDDWLLEFEDPDDFDLLERLFLCLFFLFLDLPRLRESSPLML